MNIYAIGDLHLSGNPPTKPMNVFGAHWDNHWDRIKAHWLETVKDEDIIFLVGDMSWALRLHDAIVDLEEIASMPGQKYMIRGNHDYWWSSANKMKQAMGDAITFVQGHGTAVTIPTDEGAHIVAFGGTRGYLCPGDSQYKVDTDQSIYERELMRTEAALVEMESAIASIQTEATTPAVATIQPNTDSTESDDSTGTNGATNSANSASASITRILLLHYPPFNENNAPSGFTDLMERYHVDMCIFGHLHDQISFKRIPTHWNATELKLVSADYAEFTVQKIM